MFFIIGVNQGQKNLEYHQTIICDVCGAYGRFQVYMTYTYLSLFFIPCLKWNKRYYVQTSCCGCTYELDPAIGKSLEWGEKVEIQPKDLHLIRKGTKSRYRRCTSCGYSTNEDFDFCPKCGKAF